MFKEKVNARMDGCTDGRPDACKEQTTDKRPRHKLAGLRPVELKRKGLTTRNAHVKHESCIIYQGKVMANVNVFCRQMDRHK